MCPFCNSPFSRVIATERYSQTIRRRRECRSCRAQYHTAEEYNGMIKPPPSGVAQRALGPDADGGQLPLIADASGT